MSSFSSKIGVLLAAAGSAVGLGSIWKFPYVVGENGGGESCRARVPMEPFAP